MHCSGKSVFKFQDKLGAVFPFNSYRAVYLSHQSLYQHETETFRVIEGKISGQSNSVVRYRDRKTES